MQRQLTFGGGVSPRGIRLRGQSIIEYVLIIAIIGLVIVFAGPGVAGAIRNQFNLVGNTLNSGTNGGTEGGGASGGASAGADSATVQAAVAKDAKDWTLDEQEAVAKDIAKNGTSSIAYAKAKAAMDAGTKFSMKLTDGQTLEYRIIGINHDDLAVGSGKAGLTFEATNGALGTQRMNAMNSNAGGWEKSELRNRLNSGDLWALLPAEIQSKAKAVTKMTDNKGGGGWDSKDATVTVTSDKLFLLSTTEVYGNLRSDGTQYEYYKSKGVSKSNCSGAFSDFSHWARSVNPSESTVFLCVNYIGDYGIAANATATLYVFPAWCF